MAQSLVIVSKDQILHRIRCEYIEMPGLRLTRAQAQRLWGLDERTCAQLLDSLIDEKFLQRRDDGAYARVNRRVGGVSAAPNGEGRRPGRFQKHEGRRS